MSTESTENSDGLDELAEGWGALARSNPSPLASHEWFSCAAGAFCEKDPLRVLAIRHGGTLTAAAPLRVVRRLGVRWLEVLGAAQLHEPSFLPRTDSRSLELLADALLNSPSPFLLQRLPVNDPLVGLLQVKSKGHGYMAVLPAAGTPYLPVTQTWEEFFGSLSSKRRYDFRRAQKRLEEAGKVSYRVLSPRADEVEGLLAEFYRIEALGWKGEGGSALAHRPAMRRFFDLFSRRMATAGRLRIFLLELDGCGVAGVLSVEQGKRLWILKIGYDESWSRCSPGTRLLWEAVRYGFEKKLAAVEFLGTSEEWLRTWTDRQHDYCSVVFYPFKLAGAFALLADSARLLRRRLGRFAGRGIA